MTFQAIILGGGLGTRLRPAIGDKPKVMADIGGRPFIELILDRLVQQGLNQAILGLGYRHECISSHFGHSYAGVPLVYSVESEPLGTGGAVRKALALAGRWPCFVLNGDTLTDLDFSGMLNRHSTEGHQLGIGVVYQSNVSRFGAVEVEGGRVVQFLEKGAVGPGWINSGTYLMAVDIFDGFSMPDCFSLEREFLAPNLSRLRPFAFESRGAFLDIGVPDDYEHAKALFRRGAL